MKLTSRMRLSGLAAAVAMVVLVGAPAALADSSYAWTGQAADDNWSSVGNWYQGEGVPSPPLNELQFQGLGANCDSSTPTTACYQSLDDLGPLSLNLLEIDDAEPYVLDSADPSNDTITLDPPGAPLGGASLGLDAGAFNGAQAGSQTADLAIPVILGSYQEWLVDGGTSGEDAIEVDQVSGDQPLIVDLLDAGTLYTTTLDTGAASVSGDGSLVAEELDDGKGSVTDAQLPSAGLTLGGGASLYVESTDVTSGPLTIDANQNPQPSVYIGQTETSSGGAPGTDATLAVTGNVSLDPSASLFFDIDDNGTAPGTDYSDLTATGNVDLADATLYLNQGADDAAGDCADLSPGDSFPVITASGSLTGDLTYVDSSGNPETLSAGQISAPLPVGSDTCTGSATAELTYGPTAITATIVAAPTLGAQGPTIAGTPAVGDTLTATGNGTWTGYPAPTYSYQWLACGSGGTCSLIPGATGNSYTLTSAQDGEQIELEVIAANSAGSSFAYSNVLGPLPVPAAPAAAGSQSSAGGAGTTSPTTSGASITSQTVALSKSQIDRALDAILSPKGKLAKIPRLLAAGGYVFTFDAPGAGRLTVIWSTAVGRHKETVATGGLRANAAGNLRLRIELTRLGRLLLKRSSHLRMTATTSFTPPGQTKVVSVTSLRLT